MICRLGIFLCVLCGENQMEAKSQKELAFLQDLYVTTDWGERFAALVDAHVEAPKEGRALYVAAGNGGPAPALQEKAGAKLKVICVDAKEQGLETGPAQGVMFSEGRPVRRGPTNPPSFYAKQV